MWKWKENDIGGFQRFLQIKIKERNLKILLIRHIAEAMLWDAAKVTHSKVNINNLG